MKSLKWLLFGILAVLSLLIGFFYFNPSEAGQKFSVFGYWNILALFIWFSAVIAKTYRSSIERWFAHRSNWIVVTIIVAATVFLYSREGGGFKITFDEYTISNVSKSLHYDRLAVFQESSIPKIDDTSSVDKRPLLFHFLVASAHDLFGYSLSNAFYLNGLLTAVFLLLLYICVTKLYDSRAGWLATALACSTPIISQNSSGGGLEVVNLVGIFSCLLLALKYSEKPESISRFSSLVIAVALFSHARYESPFLVFPVIVVIALNWIRIRSIQISWTAALAPVFFVPIAWQHVYVNSRPDFKQLANESDAFFSLDYVAYNFGHAINFLFIPDKFDASAPLVAALGAIGLVTIIVLNCTRGNKWIKAKPSLFAAQVFGISLLGEFLLILGFSYGQIDNPMVTRLGLPFFILANVCAGLSLSILATVLPKSRTAVYCTVSLCFFLALQKFSNHLYTSNNMILKRVDWVMDWHNRLPKGNYLYISHLSQIFELHEIGNINIKRAISNLGSLEMHMDLKTFDEIYVVQFFGQTYSDNKTKEYPLSGNDLGPWFELETVDEVSMLPMNFTRLSRVKSVRSSTDPEKGEVEIRDELLSSKNELINEISQDSYRVWRKTIP